MTPHRRADASKVPCSPRAVPVFIFIIASFHKFVKVLSIGLFVGTNWDLSTVFERFFYFWFIFLLFVYIRSGKNAEKVETFLLPTSIKKGQSSLKYQGFCSNNQKKRRTNQIDKRNTP
jgi:hypothetical protein